MDHVGTLFTDLKAMRSGQGTSTPRTLKLMKGTLDKKAQKLGEEAVELVIEAVAGRRKGTIEESADLVYNLVVLWEAAGITPNEVWDEMGRRRESIGIAEKLPKPPAKDPPGKETKKARKSAPVPVTEGPV